MEFTVKTVKYALQMQLVDGKRQMVIGAGDNVLYRKLEAVDSAPELIYLSSKDKTTVTPVYGAASVSHLESAPDRPARVIVSVKCPDAGGNGVFVGLDMPSRIFASFSD